MDTLTCIANCAAQVRYWPSTVLGLASTVPGLYLYIYDSTVPGLASVVPGLASTVPGLASTVHGPYS